MRITNELRRFARDMDFELTLAPIADRIDAEHEAQVADAFETRNSDENLESDGWIKLPVDADGVPIRIGDKVVDPDGCTFDVGFIYLNSSDTWTVGDDCAQWSASKYHHHKPKPTTEDVLRELLDMWCSESDNRNASELVSEYAKRLQLKEVDS